MRRDLPLLCEAFSTVQVGNPNGNAAYFDRVAIAHMSDPPLNNLTLGQPTESNGTQVYQPLSDRNIRPIGKAQKETQDRNTYGQKQKHEHMALWPTIRNNNAFAPKASSPSVLHVPISSFFHPR